MSTRNTILIAGILIVSAAIASGIAYLRLPEQMASHWNIYDQVDGYIARPWGVALMPLVALGMLLLFLLFPQIDPLKANIAKFRETFNLFLLLLMAFLFYLHGLTLLWNLGYSGFRMSMAMLPALGLLFIFIGYLLRKAKRNWFIGIRTPWTLSSDRVWNETHRLGSTFFVVSGLLTLIGSLFGRNAVWFMLVPILGSTLFLVVYSYVLYRRETRA